MLYFTGRIVLPPFTKSYPSSSARELSFGSGYLGAVHWDTYTYPISTGGSVTYSPYSAGPGWKKTIKAGNEVTTDMWGTKDAYTGGHSEFTQVTKLPDFNGNRYVYGIKGDIGANLGNPTDPSLYDLSKADNLAKERISSKILGVQRKLQSGVVLGELRETIHLIRNPLGALFENSLKYCDTLRKRARIYKRLKERKKLLADSWLQYSLGIAPLVSDINNAAEAAAQIITNRLPRETVTGRGKDTISSSVQRQSDAIGYFILDIDRRISIETEVKYTALVSVSNDTTSDDLDTLGISFGNFLPTVWEVLPFSFVADYFTNAGKVIDTLAINESRLRWCYKGYKRTTREELTKIDARLQDPVGVRDYDWLVTSPGPMPKREKTEFRREGGQPLPVPSLRFKLPFDSSDFTGVDFTYGKARALNLAALAASNALRG